MHLRLGEVPVKFSSLPAGEIQRIRDCRTGTKPGQERMVQGSAFGALYPMAGMTEERKKISLFVKSIGRKGNR